MPQFSPGSAHIYIAPITVSPSGLSCETELYLGPDEMTKVVTSGLVAFTSTGASQDIRLPVTMPSTEGTYHGYIDVYAGGVLIGAYVLIEDVVIGVPVPLVPCVYCGATFTTETALVDHMEASHPGKPYLIYAYPTVNQVVGGKTLYLNYKIYTPTVPQQAGCIYSAYKFVVYIPDFSSTDTYPYNRAIVAFTDGTPEGFYEGNMHMYVSYSTTAIKIPPGIYSLFSRATSYKQLKGEDFLRVVERFWSNVDTGQTITVV